MLRAGVIGAGYWGSKVAREYIALVRQGRLESVAVCDVDQARLTAYADMCETFVDLGQLLQEVDMLHICTPNSTHYEIARRALQLGKNVLVEKPMAEKADLAFDLVELSMKKGVILQVGHIFRFANIVRKIRELFMNGEFGQSYYFCLEWTHLIPPIENADVIFDLLPHPLDIVNFITGQWPTDFECVGRSVRGNGQIEAASIQAMYDGFFAHVHLSWVFPMKNRELTIIGAGKSVTADCVRQRGTIYEESRSRELIVEPNNTIRSEIENFLESTRTGRSNYNSSIVGARSIAVISQAAEKIKTVRSHGNQN